MPDTDDTMLQVGVIAKKIQYGKRSENRDGGWAEKPRRPRRPRRPREAL